MARSTLEEFKRLLWQTFNNNYSNGNLQLSFPEKVPETEAPQLAYTAYPAYTKSYMLHILLYDLYIIRRFCVSRKMSTLPTCLKSSSSAVAISFFKQCNKKCSL